METSRKYEDKDHAGLYSKYRPTYQDRIYDIIVDSCRKPNTKRTEGFDVAVDVGCGNGQSTFPLCRYFNHVIGYDVSRQQIAHALNDNLNLTFKVGPAEQLDFQADGSVDLVTSFQALHWFDLTKFYEEVKRVLKPGGVFAAYGYGISRLDNAVAEEEYKKFYSDFVLPYLDPQSHHCNLHHYRSIGLPFEHFQRIETEDIDIYRYYSVDDFIGYVASTAGWRNYRKANPDTDVLENLRKNLQSIYKGREFRVRWPGFMLLGRKPSMTIVETTTD